MIANLFELVASGQRKAAALAHVTALGLRTRAGRPLSQWTLAKLLRNSLYCGRVEKPDWGVSVKGDFTPLISAELFYRVQDVLAGRAIPAVPHYRENERFPLRGLLLCTVCGRPATASTSKGKTKPFSYYHCHRARGHFRVNAQKIEAEFLTLLESLQPNPDRMRLIEEIFRQVWHDKQSTGDTELRLLKTSLEKSKARKQRILNQMADGTLQGDDFNRLYESVNTEIQASESSLAITQRIALDVDTALSYLMHLFWNSRILWEQSDLA